MIESYSQCGQDVFVTNLIPSQGTFLDLGCYLPRKINNTYLLEKNGWNGISIDINDYSNEWKSRSTKFIKADCFSLEYKEFLQSNFKKNFPIDYLSIDMEKIGERYKLVNKVLETGFEFKIITIEHDGHISNEFILNERNPQRELLKKYGYELICSDVSNQNDPDLFYEDWWINPKYFNKSETEKWKADRICCSEIFKKLNIDYKINEESLDWSDY